KGERLIATAEGVYREDERGRVKVIQELVVDTVSPATGDLPRSGVASVNAFIRRGVTSGASVQTTEDVFVGTPREPGTLDPGTRLRARHLLVRGLVAGGVLPGPLLDGELDALDPAEQRDIRSELDRSEIQVEGILAAREIAGRNLAAGQVLVQGSVRGAALEVVGDVRVDGDLIGGVVSCSGTLFVAGDLGAGAGTPTRLRLGVEGPLARRRGQLSEELRQQRHRQQERLEALAAHDSTMATRGRRSPFWAALMAGQKRPPARPVERRLLVQFLEASRERKRLEAALYETQQEVEGTERLVAGLAAEDDGGGSGVRILVGGRTYPGVVLEAVRPMTPEDGPREVLDRVGRRTTLADLRRSLTERVEHYISLYEPSVDERRETLDRIFEGAERRPSAPRVPDRRFEVALGFPEAEGDAPLRLEGAMFLRAHDPDTPYLKHRAVVLAVLRRAAISIEETAGHLAFRCSPGQAIVRPWQEDEETLAVLEGFAVTGTSGRQHLLA
ncbi:MAG: FapA family protein, partial [Gemmatimonadota bacterium]